MGNLFHNLKSSRQTKLVQMVRVSDDIQEAVPMRQGGTRSAIVRLFQQVRTVAAHAKGILRAIQTVRARDVRPRHAPYPWRRAIVLFVGTHESQDAPPTCATAAAANGARGEGAGRTGNGGRGSAVQPGSGKARRCSRRSAARSGDASKKGARHPATLFTPRNGCHRNARPCSRRLPGNSDVAPSNPKPAIDSGLRMPRRNACSLQAGYPPTPAQTQEKQSVETRSSLCSTAQR